MTQAKLTDSELKEKFDNVMSNPIMKEKIDNLQKTLSIHNFDGNKRAFLEKLFVSSIIEVVSENTSKKFVDYVKKSIGNIFLSNENNEDESGAVLSSSSSSEDIESGEESENASHSYNEMLAELEKEYSDSEDDDLLCRFTQACESADSSSSDESASPLVGSSGAVFDSD